MSASALNLSSWDVAGWVENQGRWRRLLTFVIDFSTLYLLGALLAHTASSPRLRQAPSRCRWHLMHTHTHTPLHSPFYYHHTPERGRIDALGQFSKCGSVQLRHIKWLVINLAWQLQTTLLLSVINSIGAWGLPRVAAGVGQQCSPNEGTLQPGL